MQMVCATGSEGIFNFIDGETAKSAVFRAIFESQPPFTDIITCDDGIRKHILQAAALHGLRIPYDLSVVTMQGMLPPPAPAPTQTGPASNFSEMGIEAAKMFESKTKRIRMRCQWIEGDSFGPPPAKA